MGVWEGTEMGIRWVGVWEGTEMGIRWVGVWEGTEIHAGCMMENPEKRDGFEYNCLNDLMILKWIFKSGKEGAAWDCLNTEPVAISFEYRQELSTSKQSDKLVDWLKHQ